VPTRSEKIEKGLVTAWLKTLRENPGTRWVSLRRPSAWLAAASAVNNLCPPEGGLSVCWPGFHTGSKAPPFQTRSEKSALVHWKQVFRQMDIIILASINLCLPHGWMVAQILAPNKATGRNNGKAYSRSRE
jgi:hypothetical protein